MKPVHARTITRAAAVETVAVVVIVLTVMVETEATIRDINIFPLYDLH